MQAFSLDRLSWERLGCTNHLQFTKAPHGVLGEAGVSFERQGTDSTQFSREGQFLEQNKAPLRLPPRPPAPPVSSRVPRQQTRGKQFLPAPTVPLTPV